MEIEQSIFFKAADYSCYLRRIYIFSIFTSRSPHLDITTSQDTSRQNHRDILRTIQYRKIIINIE